MKKKIDVTALGEILIDFTKEGIESDLSFANAVAALCVTKRGAIPALPALSEVELFQRKESK